MTIFKPDGLGDFILAIGSIRRIGAVGGEDRLCLVVTEQVAPLARFLFPKAKVIALGYRPSGLKANVANAWSSWLRLQKVAGGEVICLRHLRDRYYQFLLWALRPSLVWAAGNALAEAWPPAWTAWERRLFRRCRAEVVDYPSAAASAGLCRELEANRRVVERWQGAAVTVKEILPEIDVSTLGVEQTGELLICPTSSSEMKSYPPGLLAEAVEGISRTQGIGVTLCGPGGSMEELDLAREALSRRGLQAAILTPSGPVELLKRIAGANAVISVDSAAAHMAAALDKPTVVILGGGYEGMYGPWSRSGRQQWVMHRTDCYDCHWRCIHPEPICIRHIEPDEVAQAMGRAMRQRASWVRIGCVESE